MAMMTSRRKRWAGAVLAAMLPALASAGGVRPATDAPAAAAAEWTPDGRYAEIYARLEVRPEWRERADKIIYRSQVHRARYAQIEAARRNGVPWFVVAALHERESSQNFGRHLHEGSPLTGRTKYVPKGRPKTGSPPYRWEVSAIDALYTLKDLENQVPDWKRSVNKAVDHLERYNGTGYRRYHPEVGVSPYLASGSQLYRGGKYVADGRFSAAAVDKQIGVLTLIKRMAERGLIRWPEPPG